MQPAHRKFGVEKKYPNREVLQIIRVKRVDGTEWLKSRGKIVGLPLAWLYVQKAQAIDRDRCGISHQNRKC
ncbi:MAG TPA: hypothetical protein VFY68_07000 [Nitrososphaeraceae archaeon]|nr:hypothetical protein [Nitrososphaeraceae archaeon]